MIIPEIYVQTGSLYTLRCAGIRCTTCAGQLGLLAECPVCGKTPKEAGHLCAHSRVCKDHNTGGYYIHEVNVPEHLNVERAQWFDEDDVI